MDKTQKLEAEDDTDQPGTENMAGRSLRKQKQQQQQQKPNKNPNQTKKETNEVSCSLYYSLGQGRELEQRVVCTASPSQSFPPCIGRGLLQAREHVRTP